MKIKKAISSLFFGNCNLLGIDIGEETIKIIELSLANGRPTLENYTKLAITSRSPSNISNTIRGWLKHHRFTSKLAATSLPASTSFFKRQLVTPDLLQTELRNFVLFNLSKTIDSPIEELVVDYEEVDICDTTLLQVVAVKRSLVGQQEQLLKNAFLFTKVIDLDIYAVARAIFYSIKRASKTTVVINLEDHRILMVVCKDKQIFSWEESRELSAKTDMDILSKELSKKILGIDQVRVLASGQIILAGPKLLLEKLQERLNKQISASIIIANPFKELSIAPKINANELANIAPEMLISFGLALRITSGN